MDNYILTYYQQIRDGSVVVGKWVDLVYTYIVNGLETGLFYFDQKKANSVIRFIEKKVHHTEGKLAPKCFKLELWQKALLSAIFGVVDKDGLRQFREIVIFMGRKNGKTMLSSAILEHMMYNDGEYGARVYCVAPKLDQADLVYQQFYQSVLLDKELAQKTKSRKSDIYVRETNSSIKKIAFNAKKADGFNCSAVVADECAAWPSEQGLKQYEVLKSAMGAREQPLMISISTAGYVNDGIYDELMKRSTRFLMGDSKEKRLLPFIYQIDEVDKWNDINELRKSNPNLGVSVKVDYLIDEIAVAEGSLSKRNEFICKYACIKASSSVAWVDSQTIEKCSGEHLGLDDFRNCYCVAGLDLSQSIDLSAVVLVFEKEGTLYTVAHCWLPREKLEEAKARDGLPYDIYIQRGILSLSGDNIIDYRDIFQYLADLVEQYQIYPLKVGFDRYSAMFLISDLRTYGFHCDDVYQGENLSPVINEVEGLLKDGKIKIGDNDLLKMHLYNSAMKRNAETNRRRLVKINPTLHIDACAALLDAMTVRQKWYPEIGEQLKNRG